jgi:phytoene dehydrogenase-like protein
MHGETGFAGGAMDVCDAAILGAGPEGLIAALALARAGLKVLVVERTSHPGGRAASIAFHPGFYASLYMDTLPVWPAALSRLAEPARFGSLLVPDAASVSLANEELRIVFADAARAPWTLGASDCESVSYVRKEIETRLRAMAAKALAPVTAPRRSPFVRPRPASWPGEDWGAKSLADLLHMLLPAESLRLHFAAAATAGRAASPFLMGSGLHLFGAARSGWAPGGLGAFGLALAHAARASGVTIRCQADITDIKLRKSHFGMPRVTAIVLAGGEEIAARAVLSTLGIKRTFLGLMAPSDVPSALIKKVGHFRMRGATARVLFALDARPMPAFAQGMPQLAASPIHVLQSLEALSVAHDSWRAGALAEDLPVTLRLPSLTDPRLAPTGKAVMTASFGAIPPKLFDGAWTSLKREQLIAAALSAAERVMPGIGATVLATHVVTPAEIENALGLTEGDLDGGEIAPDQMFGFRPFADWHDGRTPVNGLYYGGPSAAPSPFLAGAAGIRAASALFADLKIGRLE